MRTLTLTSPHEHGTDVARLQRCVNARLAARGDATDSVAVDSDYGPQTRHAELVAGYLLGLDDWTLHHDRARVQAVILDPTQRTHAESQRGHERVHARAVRDASGPHGALVLAAKLAAAHIVEHPAGSNRGPMIDTMEREVGIEGAPWCGAAARYLVLHGGGLPLTPDTRYCPSIVAHAQASTGGYDRWIAAGEWTLAKPGDLVVYDWGTGTAEHTGLLAGITAAHLDTFEGNTTFQGVEGDQSNGGAFAHRTDRTHVGVLGFARPRWSLARA